MSKKEPRGNHEVYLLHFDRPYWNTRGGTANACIHYLGYAHYGHADRIAKHRAGRGSLLVDYALRQGCEFEVARVWQFTLPSDAKNFERRKKKNGHFDSLCPVCKKEKEHAV